jgi:hypothetical protein
MFSLTIKQKIKMKTKFFYIVLTAVLSLSSLSVSAKGEKGKKASGKCNNSTVSHALTTVKETEMEIVSWMTSSTELENSNSEILSSAGNTEARKINYSVKKDSNDTQEVELVLEDWMLESFDVNSQEMSVNEEFEFEPQLLVVR